MEDFLGGSSKQEKDVKSFILLLTKEDERARSARRKDDLAAGERVSGWIFGVGGAQEGSSTLMLKCL